MPNNDGNPIKRTEQEIANKGFDETLQTPAVAIHGTSNGADVNRLKVAADGSIAVTGSSGTAAFADSGGTDRKGLVDGDRHLQVDVVSSLDSSSDSVAADGNVASGDTDAGKPVKVGGKYNATKPTFDSGDRGDFQIDQRGNLYTQEASKHDLLAYAEQLTSSASITPTSGKKLQIVWVQVVADPDGTAGNLVTIGFNGSSALYKVYALGRSALFTGATNQVLDITLENSQPVTVNIQYREIT